MLEPDWCQNWKNIKTGLISDTFITFKGYFLIFLWGIFPLLPTKPVYNSGRVALFIISESIDSLAQDCIEKK